MGRKEGKEKEGEKKEGREGGRWEGLNDANHGKGGPVELGRRKGRKHETGVITGHGRTTAREVGKPRGQPESEGRARLCGESGFAHARHATPIEPA